MKRIKVVEKLGIYKFGSVQFVYMIHHRSYRACEKKSKVSMRSKVRGFYGTSSSATSMSQTTADMN
jgi:hypothetical protein